MDDVAAQPEPLVTDSFELVVGRLAASDDRFGRLAHLTGVEIVDRTRKGRLLSVRLGVTVRGTAAQVAEFGKLLDDTTGGGNIDTPIGP